MMSNLVLADVSFWKTCVGFKTEINEENTQEGRDDE